MEFINEAVLHAAGQWWIYPLLLVFFFVDGFVHDAARAKH